MNETPSPDQQGSDASPQPGAPLYLWVLVGIMATIEFVVSFAPPAWVGNEDPRWIAFALGAFWQPILSGAAAPFYPGQPLLMFITYAFLHAGIMHLVLNSVVLLSLGKLANGRIGATRTLLVLVLSAVGGALAFGLIATTSAPMIGASGAVFGLIGLWQAWDYHMRRLHGLSVRPVAMAILALVAANVVLHFFLGGGLAWEAHLGGWLVGWLAAQSFARIRG